MVDLKLYLAIMITTLFRIVILFIVFIVNFSGITRHDVNQQRYIDLAKESQFDCVGQVFMDTAMKGSCVLISELYVLSATHVFMEFLTRPDTLYMNGNQIIVFTTAKEYLEEASKFKVKFNNKEYNVKRIVAYPGYFDTATKGACDIILLELATPVRNIQPAILNNMNNELNSHVVGVGFGASGLGDQPENVGTHHLKIAGANIVDSIGGLNVNGFGTMLFCDFDHPSRIDCNKLGDSQPEPLEYICSGGDSGGGLFRQTSTDWELIGICSGTAIDISQLLRTGYYGQIMMWTKISAFTGWISKNQK